MVLKTKHQTILIEIFIKVSPSSYLGLDVVGQALFDSAASGVCSSGLKPWSYCTR